MAKFLLSHSSHGYILSERFNQDPIEGNNDQEVSEMIIRQCSNSSTTHKHLLSRNRWLAGAAAASLKNDLIKNYHHYVGLFQREGVLGKLYNTSYSYITI